MAKIPTAEELLNKEYYHIVLDSKDTWVNVGDIEIAHNKIKYNLGRFKTELEAHQAYQDKLKELI